jgi:CDP-4-dehydro-6-deoxyglucose reductase
MTLNAKALAGLDGLSIRKLPARIAAIERPEANVAILTLQLPATPPFTFKAGQYIDLLLRDGRRRSYSMANPPHSGNIVLHIRKQNKGAISALLFPETEDERASAWKERDLLRLEGPFGTFFLREDSTKPIILLASGTGFAPIQAIVERAHYHGMQRPMTLYWGGNRPSDLYALPTCERWQAEIPGFRFVPVISAATAADHWQGRSGFVHQAVITDFPDLSGYEVYACGAPAMIAAARADFNRLRQLPADAFFADSFESSVPTASLKA